MITIFQDVLLGVGGAERVYSAVSDRREVAKRIAGLRSADAQSSDASLIEVGSWPPRDGVAILRALLLKARDQAPLPGRTLVFHHHAGLIAPYRPELACVYIHTPTRVLWEPHLAPDEADVFSEAERSYWRELERASAQRVAAIATNSDWTRDRIATFYGREAEVITPPVSLHRVQMSMPNDLDLRQPYFVTCSRLVRAKNLDLLIDAALELGWKLVIIGAGRDEPRLRSRAMGGNVVFAGERPDAEVRWLLVNAALYLSATEDDFGISVAEALCEGTRAVVPRTSGNAQHTLSVSGSTYALSGGTRALAKAISEALATPVVQDDVVHLLRHLWRPERFADRLLEMVPDGSR